MPDRKEMILQRLTEEGAKTVTFFKKLTPEQWRQQVYTTGPEWGPHDLLCHFTSAEKVFIFYSKDVANGGTGVPRDFDIDAFNAREVKILREANHSPQTLIAEFERQRAETIAFVHTLTDSDFDRMGFHPWFGDTSQENILKLLYRHAMLHQRDAHKAIESGQPVPHTEFIPPTKQNQQQGNSMSRKDAIRSTMQDNNAASLTILKNLTAEQWTTPVPSESDAPWVAKDVIIHLTVSEGGHVGQITRVVGGEDGVPADFDLNRYNRRSVQKNAEKSVEDLLKDLETAFGLLVAKLDELTESDLDKQGRHARGDVLTVEGFFLRCAEHRLEHAQQLQKSVSGGQ